jgi:hypothetical protein
MLINERLLSKKVWSEIHDLTVPLELHMNGLAKVITKVAS